jgi:hypothetical protein
VIPDLATEGHAMEHDEHGRGDHDRREEAHDDRPPEKG